MLKQKVAPYFWNDCPKVAKCFGQNIKIRLLYEFDYLDSDSKTLMLV